MKLMSNTKMFIFAAIIVLLVGGVFLGVIVGNSMAGSHSTILKNQEIDNLSFKNASLEYENDISIFEVEVTNLNPEIYNLKYIEMIFKDEENNINKLTGYIGENIEPNETKKIMAKIDKNLINSVSLEYSIIK